MLASKNGAPWLLFARKFVNYAVLPEVRKILESVWTTFRANEYDFLVIVVIDDDRIRCRRSAVFRQSVSIPASKQCKRSVTPWDAREEGAKASQQVVVTGKESLDLISEFCSALRLISRRV